jgi:DNA-binding transcriptional LysR family regulator
MSMSAPANEKRKQSTRSMRRKGSAQSAAKNNAQHFNVEYLLFFRAVADNLSFTKAARELEIDQSWLSHKIRQFEEMLGITLFIRNTRHVELTPAGQVLLDPVYRLSTVVEEARAVTEALFESMEGVLRVGCLPFSFPDPQRTRLMDEFIELYDSIRLQITSGPTPMLLEQLHLGKIDLAFVSAPFDEKNLDLLLLRENEFCFLFPRDHPLASKKSIDRQDIEGMKVVIPARHYHPAAYDLYYKPLTDAGAIVESIPEFQSAATYVQGRQMPVVCTRYAADRYATDFFVRKMANFLPPCRKYLVRLRDRHTPSQRLMWEMAERERHGNRAA